MVLEMHRRSLGVPVVWLTSVCDAMKVIRIRVALLCLSKTVASIEVVVEKVKGYALQSETWGASGRSCAYLHGC